MNTELLLIAKRLNVPVDALAGLETQSAEALENLRVSVEARLAEVGKGSFRSLASASRILTAGLNAKIAERVLGPQITAGMADMLEPNAAAKIASKFQPEFIADLVPHLMGDAFAKVLDLLPEKLVREVVEILDKRDEVVILATMVEALNPQTAADLVQELSDAGLAKVLPLIRRAEVLSATLKTMSAKSQQELLDRVPADVVMLLSSKWGVSIAEMA